MIGYNEVLQTIAAMIIFTMVLTTANRYMLGNIERKVNSEVEVHAVTLAQDFIEFSKEVSFDQATAGGVVPENVPDDFVQSNPVPKTSVTKRENIQYFEQFNGYSETVDTKLGQFTANTTIDYMGPDLPNLNNKSSAKSIYKQITVNVSNPSLRNDVVLSYTRVYKNSD